MTGIPPQVITAEQAAYEAHWQRLGKIPLGWDRISSEARAAWKAALEAAAPFLAEDGWDAARDRATETNQARRDERERCAQLAEQLVEPVASAIGQGLVIRRPPQGIAQDVLTIVLAALLRKEATDAA